MLLEVGANCTVMLMAVSLMPSSQILGVGRNAAELASELVPHHSR